MARTQRDRAVTSRAMMIVLNRNVSADRFDPETSLERRWALWTRRCGRARRSTSASRPAPRSAPAGASSVRQIEASVAAPGQPRGHRAELAEIDSFAVDRGVDLWRASARRMTLSA